MTNNLDPEIQSILEDHYYDAEQTFSNFQDTLKHVAMSQMEKTWYSPKKTQSRNIKSESRSSPPKICIGKSLRITAKIVKALCQCGKEIVQAFNFEETEVANVFPCKKTIYPSTNNERRPNHE